MTNEEAKIIIGNIPIKPKVLDDSYDITEYQEAKAMAIKALEQQSCEDKQDCEHCIHTYGTLGCCDMVNNEWIYDCDFGREQYRKEHGKPCEDCISREALLNSLEEPMNWTDSEAEIQQQRDYEGFIELVKNMPSVTPKMDILDKIRAEIDQKQYDFMANKDYDEGIRFGLMLAYQIIDKYKKESEE